MRELAGCSHRAKVSGCSALQEQKITTGSVTPLTSDQCAYSHHGLIIRISDTDSNDTGERRCGGRRKQSVLANICCNQRQAEELCDESKRNKI